MIDQWALCKQRIYFYMLLPSSLKLMPQYSLSCVHEILQLQHGQSLHAISQPVPRPLSEQQSYSNSPFFANQLSAFDSWLLQGNDGRSFPEQLPIVLQVLLSSVHRQRALHLLGRFLDLGDWAVHLALSVGIFPYVLKLLQSSTSELRPLLAFIWAKILAVDLSCQNDLIRDKGHEYFLKILRDPHSEIRDKTISAFILTSLMNKCEAAQRALMQNQYIGLCSDLLFDEKASVCPWLRRWLIIGLGRIWNDFDPARWQAVRSVTYDHLYTFLSDPVPEVRAAAVYALGTLISNQSNQNDHATNVEINIAEMLVTVCQHDGSALVRGELIVSLHHFVLDFEKKFVKIAQELYDTVAARMQEQQQQQQSMRASNSMMNMSAESDPDTPSPSFLPARFPSVRRLSSTTEAQEDTNTDLFPISPLPDNIRRSSSMRSVEASPSGSRNARLPPVDSIFVGSPPESRNDTITTLLQTAAQGTGSPGSAVTSGRRRRSPHSRRTRPNATLLRQRHLVIEIMHHMADNNITTMKYHLNIWRCFINAMFDPHHDVMTDAIKLVNYITRKIKHGEPIPGVSEQSGSSTWTAKHTTTRPSVSPGTFLPPSLPKVTISKAQFTVGSPPDTDGLSRSPAGPSSLGSSPVPTMIHRPGGGGILATVQKNIVTGHIMVSQPRQSARHVKADKPVRHANQHSISSDTTCDDTTPAIDQTDGGIAQSSTSAAVAVQNGETPNKTANGACVSRKPIIFSKFADWSTSKFAAHVSTMLDACTHFEGFTRPRLPVPLWARQGFDKVCDEMQSEEIAINNGATVDSQYFMTRHGGLQQADRQDSLTSISFHPVLPLMLVSQSDTINLWNTDRSCKLAYMHNHHSVLTQLSMVKIINPLTHGHIMTGTTDGRVKVWDTRFGQFLEPGFLTKDDEYSPRLLGAWDATGDLRRISPSNTMKDSTIYSWDQDNGTLLLSGNVRVLRVWNVDREQKVCDLPLGMRDPKTEEQLMATCLSADGNMAAVGSENGFVRLFDTRLPSNSSNITTFRHQRAKLLHVQIREQDSSHVERVVTGSADGRLIVYEPRMYKEPIVDYCLSSTVGQCITMSSHARLPLIATATSSAGVQIYDYNARRVAGTIRYNEGFMAHRLGLVSTMSFHPFTSKIAIGGRDNAIMVYGVDRGALSPVPD